MAKDFKQHFAVLDNLHTAVKSVAVEDKLEINELVQEVLLKDPKIKAAYERIGGQ